MGFVACNERSLSAVVDRSQRQRQAPLIAGDEAHHRELGIEPGVRLSRPVDAGQLLYEYELRRGGLLPHPLRRPSRDYPILLGDFALSRPSVEQLRNPRPVLRHHHHPIDGRLPERLQQSADPALAIWRDPDLASVAEYRDRAAARARHHLLEPAALRL